MSTQPDNMTPEEELRAKLNKLHGDILGTHASNDSCIEETFDLFRTTILSCKPEKPTSYSAEDPDRGLKYIAWGDGIDAAFTAITEALGGTK